MKKTRPIFFVLMLLTVVGAMSQTKHYTLDVKDFDELKVVDGVNVEYFCDASKAGLIEFDASASVASVVMFESSKSKLTISLAQTETPFTELPTVKVYSSRLIKASNEGDSTVVLNDLPPAPSLNLRVIGNGTLTAFGLDVADVNAAILSGHGQILLSGKAREASLKIAGTGQIDASGLTADEANCSNAGTGKIYICVEKKLSVGGLGGKVFYYGAPEIKKRFLSAVKLEQLR